MYGYSVNAAVMLMPALRYVFGEVSFTIEEKKALFLREKDNNFDFICINAGLAFYEIEEAFVMLERGNPEKTYKTAAFAWDFVPEENLDMLLKYKTDIIMFDLKSEEEFAFCRTALLQNKTYRSKYTFNRNRNHYLDRVDIYNGLPKNQKYACFYMLTGKSQKEFQIDFGFKSLSTASSHWNMVLKKFGVKNVYELRKLFR